LVVASVIAAQRTPSPCSVFNDSMYSNDKNSSTMDTVEDNVSGSCHTSVSVSHSDYDDDGTDATPKGINIGEFPRTPLPAPAGCILLSPWVDLADTSLDSWDRNSGFDYLPVDLAQMFARCYKGDGFAKPRNSKSDTSTTVGWEHVGVTHSKPEDLKNLPPLLVIFGSAEVLMDQILLFCSKCIEQGITVDCHMGEHMVHVYPLFAFTGMEQCHQAFEKMTSFMMTVTPPYCKNAV
jgi:hypothetical protein